MKQCIESCNECARVCETTLEYCESMGGNHAEESHLNLLRECAAVCKEASEAMRQERPEHKEICSKCAEICIKCAESCESIDPDDSIMKKCVEVCRKCADDCKAVAE